MGVALKDINHHRLLAGILAAAILYAPAALAELAVVVAGPATGRHAETLPVMVDGARRGAGGHSVRITDVDDGCEAARAEGAARMIVAAKPDLVIGHPCPAAAIAAAKVYAAAGVVFIALGVRHADLTDKRAGPTIFRLAGRDDRQGQAAASELLALAPQGRIAIVQDRTAYARALTAAVTAEIAARKLPAPLVVPIVAGRRDYDADLLKLKAAPPDAIFFAGYPSEAAVVLRGLRKAHLSAPLIASDANATEDFAATVATSDGKDPVVKVMVRAPNSGGLDATELRRAATRALSAWLGIGEASTPAEIVARLTTPTAMDNNGDALVFDAKGDARIPSFSAVPLVAGRWPRSAAAGP